MSFLGIVGAGLAGGAAGAGEGLAQSGLEQQKADAIALRDQALASLQRQTHSIELQQGNANIPLAAKAKADADTANLDQTNATTASQVASKGAAEAAVPLTKQQEEQALDRKAVQANTASRDANTQAFQQAAIEARNDRTSAQSNTAADKLSATGDRAQPIDQWTTVTKDQNGEILASRAVPGVTQKVTVGTPGRDAKPSDSPTLHSLTGGMFGSDPKAAIPEVNPGTQYFFNNKPITTEDYQAMLSKTGRGGLRGAYAGSAASNSRGAAASQDAGVPAGYTYAGIATDGSGRTVYQDAAGNKIAR